jgi:hypothetical protein
MTADSSRSPLAALDVGATRELIEREIMRVSAMVQNMTMLAGRPAEEPR